MTGEPAEPGPDTAAEPPEEPRAKRPPLGSSRHWRVALEWVGVLAVAFGLVALVQATSLQPFRIPSDSMAPTLQRGDRVLVNKWSYRVHDVRRGDIIVFDRPDDPAITEAHLVKRVIGLPGETVTIVDNQVLIDGRLLTEPYVPAGALNTSNAPFACPPSAPCHIPEGQVWVMGDNRSNSRDSRYFGPLPESKIVGRAFQRLWPLSRVGGL